MFFAILTVIFNDGTKNKVAINTFNTDVEALKQCYSYMSQYTGMDNVKSINAIAKNEIGGIIKNEYWVKPVPVEPTEVES